MLLILGLPCAPLLAVMLVLLGGMSPWASLVVFGVILAQIIIVGTVLSRMLPGGNSDFILELPPIRVPGIWNLVKKTGWRIWWFSKEALPLFLTATFILFLLDKAGALDLLQRMGKPVVTGILGLPSESIQVMIMTLIRRESGAALLKQFSDAGMFDNVQVVVTLLVLTFLSPCVNAVLVMLKERGTRDTLAIMAFVTPYAIVVGAVVNLVCRALGVTF
jgi:ferrous iron transport protein B